MLPRSSLQVLTLLFRFLTTLLILLGQLCGVGKYLPSECSSGTWNENLPTASQTWQIDIDTTNGKVLWWYPGGVSNKARQATISDFSNMYHIVMVFGGGYFDLSLNNSFLKTKYNPAHVSYPTSTRVKVSNGATTRIIGEKITTTSVTSYKITFTNYGTNICYGLISIPDINTVTLDNGDFQAHWGVCVGSTWPTGQIAIVCQCKDCAANCATCTGASFGECTACKELYSNYSGTSCSSCHAYCSVCTGSTNSACSACRAGYYLQPAPSATTCLSTCPTEYWKDTTILVCAPCDVACSTCTGPNYNQCSACKTGYFLQPSSTICLNSCPNGYYGTSSNTCAICHTYCSICTGSSNSACSACKSGYFFSAPTSCVTACPSGTWKDTTNQICAPCDVACSTCTGPNYNQCSACKTGYFLQPSSTICLNSCPNGYYGTSSNTCAICHTYCSICTGILISHCSACKSGYFLQPSATTCHTSCPSGYWKDTTNNICATCNAACATCSDGTPTQCTTCNTGYFRQPSSTTCLDSCPNGYYGTSSNTCSSCHAYCSVCTGILISQCSACKSGYFLQPAPSATTCTNTCPSGYWKDTTNNICAPCDIACEACSDGTNSQCTACKVGYFLQPSSTICFSSCPAGYWENTPSKTCSPCNTYCSVCTGSSNNQCSACKSGYFLQPAPSATTCTNTCPSGYWKDTANNICAPCDSACSVCTGSSNTQCSACKSGYFLQPAPSATTCANTCPSGYWKDTTNNICAPCDIACTVCLGGTNTQCTECKPGYNLQSLTTCYSNCPPDYGWDSSIPSCVICDVSCSACTGTSNTQCLACKPGYFLQPAPSETTCTNTCPSGYWKDTTNNICAECNVACAVCSDGNHTQCTSCNSGYFLQPSSSTICLNSCPEGYWGDSTNHICATCDPACSVCTGANSNQCSACKPGYFLQPSSTSCLNTCSTPGYWEDAINHVCAECNVACAACTDVSNTQCSDCNSGYFLQPAPSSTTCLNTCPTEYWQDTATRKCMPCDNACSDCLDGTHTQCSSCKLGYFLQPSSTICLDSCPTIGYWQDTANHLCANCNIWCSQCTGSLNTQCSACSEGYFLQPSSTTCLNTCPTEYWQDTATRKCMPCDNACSDCLDGTHTQCSSCKLGYFLQPSSTICLNSCPDGSWEDTTNHICSSCDISCSVCTGANNDECSSCNSGYFLQPSSTICLDSCPVGYWRDTTSNICMECDISCSVCSDGTNTQCSSCKAGYFLQVGSTTCLTSCANGTWPNSTSNLCLNCDVSCVACTGPENTQCSACKPGYFLQPSSTSCLSTCPPIYFYPNTSLHACQSNS